MKYIEIESQEALAEILETSEKLNAYAFQNINFINAKNLRRTHQFTDCIFLGCTIPTNVNEQISDDCLLFPKINNLPYNSFKAHLYTPETLFNKYELGNPDSYENTLDKKVYNHYLATGKEADDIKETLARRLHDHAMTDALYDFLANYEEKKIVAIMGGHSISRAEPSYLQVVQISKKLTELGYLMISGGGPGAMEATHVGAWMAGRTAEDVAKVIAILAQAPIYNNKFWLDKAFEVLKVFPTSSFKSLGIPTWLYGHEPPTPFATNIAKYFANSVREDGLLTIAKGGVIFSPGSAGTVQEVFQDGTQNHYLSFGYASPMVFLNKSFWSTEMPIYPLLKSLSEEGKYKNLILSLCDTPEEVINEIEKFV